MVPVLKLSAIQVLGLAAIGIALGEWLQRRFPVLERMNVPAPITGGLVYALLAALLRDRVVNFELDLVLRDILMVAFFTTIGLGASFALMKEAGSAGAIFLALATAGAVLQNLLGMGVLSAFGRDPLLGVISGAAALTGGPATALAFGPTFERLGVTGASTLGLACATFGITAGGLLGGVIGGRIVRKHGLKPAAVPAEHHEEHHSFHTALLPNAVAVGAAMGLGSLISAGIERAGVILPAYIGAMIAAAVIRNLDDRVGWVRISERHITLMGNVALSFFIVMALMGLRLWELANLAAPMLVALAAQVALIWALCAFTFRIMGRDYEAAVMSAGFCGFMLGTTASALASMHELERKHGPAPRAMVVVPVVGAFLIDFTNALVITATLNLLR